MKRYMVNDDGSLSQHPIGTFVYFADVSEEETDLLQELRNNIVAKILERVQFRERQKRTILLEINDPEPWGDCERNNIIKVYTMVIEELRLVARSIEERRTIWDLECELAEAIYNGLTLPEGTSP